MNINKIYVTVDKHDYAGLYWLTEMKGHNYLNVSYGSGLKKISRRIDCDHMSTVDNYAKTILSELIENM